MKHYVAIHKSVRGLGAHGETRRGTESGEAPVWQARRGSMEEYRGRSIPWYSEVMKVDKMSVSFDATLGDEIRQAAREGGVGLSSWLSEAAARKLRAEALREFLDEWEAEFGPVTPEELAQAEADLGLGPGKPEA